MTNASKTIRFLQAIDSRTRAMILSNIAAHYGISSEDAYLEVIDPDAESLLDYVTGPLRSGVHVLMQRHRISL